MARYPSSQPSDVSAVDSLCPTPPPSPSTPSPIPTHTHIKDIVIKDNPRLASQSPRLAMHHHSLISPTLLNRPRVLRARRLLSEWVADWLAENRKVLHPSLGLFIPLSTSLRVRTSTKTKCRHKEY